MLVNDYYKENTIFSDSTIVSAMITAQGFDWISDKDLEMIDFFLRDNYANCPLQDDDPIFLQTMAANLLYKNQKYYEGIYNSLIADFDPLETINISETEEISTEGNNVKTGKEKDTASNSQTATPNLTETTNLGGTKQLQNRTFDNATLADYEKEINGGSDVTTKTGTSTTSGSSSAQKEFDNVKNEYEEGKEVVRTKRGMNNIDWRKALEDFYAPRRINLIDRIAEDFQTESIIPIHFPAPLF